MNKPLLARKLSDGRTQTLCEHTNEVSDIVVSISHYPNTAKLLAFLHDLGKSSKAFQDYIKNGGERGSVIHAWQGAFWADELFGHHLFLDTLLTEIIGVCVGGHHNHLNDLLSPDGTTVHFDKFLNTADPKYFLDEIKRVLGTEEKDTLRSLFDNAKVELENFLSQVKQIYSSKNSANFALSLFVKYAFSCLVDADRLDAYLFERKQLYTPKTVNWDALIAVFENNIDLLYNTSRNSKKIDSIRKSVSDKCKQAANKETGIYQLAVPTGGGKTFSSFHFALHHCKTHGKNRIIYVIPYLSIIDQTSKNLHNILNLPENNEIIFEHHSNIIEPEDENSSELKKLSAARWACPVVLTTMVEFLESLMSSKSGKLRKFASLANSVIIFDEIQSLPVKAIHCFNEIATFLSKMLNTTIILCSATQPTLESTQRANLLLPMNDKLIDCEAEFKEIRRVKTHVEPFKNCESASDFILEKAEENGNCLVIVNTKKSALNIYTFLKNKSPSYEILHLSTSMCPRHRMETIKKLEECLHHKKKVVCVSTQLIEAGIDISFSCVIRAMAGLDSIAQAAGRCNRNGESAVPKPVYTFVLKDENLEKLTDIALGKEITQQIILTKSSKSDLLDKENIQAYYKLYFAGKNAQMDYPTASGGQTIYNMLSGNDYAKQNHINKTGNAFSHYLPFAFYSADKSFFLIEQNTKSVVVLFGKAKIQIDEYKLQPSNCVTKQKLRILKQLQKYSVALYQWEVEKLHKQNALDLLDEDTGILIAAPDYYSQEVGITLEHI